MSANEAEYADAPEHLRKQAERAALDAAYAEVNTDDSGEDVRIDDLLRAFVAVQRVEDEFKAKWAGMTASHEGKKPSGPYLGFAHHIVASAILAKSDFGSGDVRNMHPYNATAFHFARLCSAVLAMESVAMMEMAADCEFYAERHASAVLKLLAKSEANGHDKAAEEKA